jgi:hypothetical protein
MGESMFAFIFALGLFSTDLLADRKLTDVKYQPPDYKAQQGKEIAVTPDGGFIFLASVSDEDDPALVVKFDSSGKKEWETTLPDISPGIGSLAVSKEGSIYVAGTSANAQLCGSLGLKSDFIKTCSKISKLDSNGELEWEKTIQDPNYSMYIYSVGLLPNGSIVGVGNGRWGNKIAGGILVQINSNGEVSTQWEWAEEPASGYLMLYSLAPTPDGGFLVTGSKTLASGEERAYLAKYSADRKRIRENLSSGRFSKIIAVKDRFVARKREPRNTLEIYDQDGILKRTISTIPKAFAIENICPLSEGRFALLGSESNGWDSKFKYIELNTSGQIFYSLPKKDDGYAVLYGAAPIGNSKLALLGTVDKKLKVLFLEDELPPPPPALTTGVPR